MLGTTISPHSSSPFLPLNEPANREGVGVQDGEHQYLTTFFSLPLSPGTNLPIVKGLKYRRASASGQCQKGPMMLSMMHDSASFCMNRCWKLYLGAAALASAAAAAAAEVPLG